MGGHCWLDERLQPHCKCPQSAKGDRCQVPESCNVISCKNGGWCTQTGECSCPNGWGGFYCEIGEYKNVSIVCLKLKFEIYYGKRKRECFWINWNFIFAATSKYSTPSFRGNSYLVIPPQRIPQKEKRGGGGGTSIYVRPAESVQITLKFSTIHPDGLLLWSSGNNFKFLGLGIENGHIKLASSLLGLNNSTVDIPAGGFVADGGWHTVQIEIDQNLIILSVDGRTIFSERRRNMNINNMDVNQYVTMEDVFYIGKYYSPQIIHP